jgi:16S rRNA (guanine(966)-N(2))-methyltransferase RsmD
MKENLFNILAADIPGARFLDLFSGTGAIGIEALSRGAESAVFVDTNCVLLKKNLALAGFTANATVLQSDYAAAMRKLNEKHMEFDVIFMDPPYYKGLVPQAIRLANEMDLLGPSGLLAAELAPDEDLPLIDDLSLYKVKRYSTSVFFIIQKGI